jgi:FlaA1/EpsC-like NDP-sugar epimerase
MMTSETQSGNSLKSASADFRKNTLYCGLDSLLAGVAFYLGFIIHKALDPQLPFLGRVEILLLSLGMAFCYAFIYVYRRSYNNAKRNSHKANLIDLVTNLSLAYLLDLAMLFVMKDNSFMAFRVALGIGLVVSIILLYAGRMASGVIKPTAKKREGKRKLILAGLSEHTDSSAPAIMQAEMRKQSGGETERYVDDPMHSNENLLEAIDILHDGKNRVLIHKSADNSHSEREAVSSNR